MEFNEIAISDIDGNRVTFEKGERGWQFSSVEKSPIFDLWDMRSLAYHLVSAVWNRPFGYTLRALRRTIIAAQLDVQEASTRALALADPKLQGVVPMLQGVAPKLQGVVDLVDQLGDAVHVTTRRSWPRRVSPPKVAGQSTGTGKPKKSRRPTLVDAWCSLIEAGIARRAYEDNQERASLYNEAPMYRESKAREERLRRKLEQTLNSAQREAFTEYREASAHLKSVEDALAFRRTYRVAYTDSAAFMLGLDLAPGDHQRRQSILAELKK